MTNRISKTENLIAGAHRSILLEGCELQDLDQLILARFQNLDRSRITSGQAHLPLLYI